MGEVFAQITIPEFKKLVRNTIMNGKTLYVEGAPGIGKTQIIQEESAAAGKKVVTIYPPVLDIGDIVTKIPIKEREDYYKLCEVVAAELPREEGHVLFIDEMRHGEPSVLRMFYRLILEGKVGSTYQLPVGTAIIAASNPTEDVQTEEMEGPLFDRFIYRVKLKTTVKDFKEYMLNKNKPYASYIIGFLEFKPDCLTAKDGEEGNQRYILTPRRWDYMTGLKANSLDEWLDLTDKVLPPGVSAEFGEFVKKVQIYSKDIREYVDGSEPFPRAKADQIAVMTAIVAHLNTDPKYEDLVDSIMDMKMRGADEEVIALTVFQSIRTLKTRKKLTSLGQVLNRKNRDKLMNVLTKYQYAVEGI